MVPIGRVIAVGYLDNTYYEGYVPFVVRDLEPSDEDETQLELETTVIACKAREQRTMDYGKPFAKLVQQLFDDNCRVGKEAQLAACLGIHKFLGFHVSIKVTVGKDKSNANTDAIQPSPPGEFTRVTRTFSLLIALPILTFSLYNCCRYLSARNQST